MDKALSFTELLTELGESPQPAPTNGLVHTQSRQIHRASIMPAGDSAIQQADLEIMVNEARRNVKLQSGLIGKVLTQLRGDDFQRAQYKTMLARIEASNAAEDAKLGVMIAISVRLLGMKVAISGMEEMERYLARFDPESRAGALGRDLIEENQRAILQLIGEVSTANKTQVLRALGISR